MNLSDGSYICVCFKAGSGDMLESTSKCELFVWE